MNIFNVIDEWDLNNPSLNFDKYSRTSINKMIAAIDDCYKSKIKPTTGRVHHSLPFASDIVECNKPIESLAIPLIYSKQIVLPDPLYSLLSPNANSTWHRLPESGNRTIFGEKSISVNWNSYFSTSIEDRISFLNRKIPNIVSRLEQLRSLIESGYIILQPWEPIVAPELEKMKQALSEISTNKKLLDDVTQRYSQGNYNLGVRLGPLEVFASEDSPQAGLKKGQNLWMVDKTEVLLIGLIHAFLTKELSSNFIESLPGDRVVFDFLRTGGQVNTEQKIIISSVKCPNLESALWDEIVSIKKDSELVDQFSTAISNLAFVNENDQCVLLKGQLEEIGEKLKNETTISKYVTRPFIDLSVGTIAGIGSNVISGLDIGTSVLAAGVGTGVMFLMDLVSGIFNKENTEKRKRRDIILNVNKHL